MKMLLIIAAALGAAPTAAAAAAPSGNGQEARIAFADRLNIRNFRADGRDAVYIQDFRRRWYRAGFVTPCRQLPFARSIAVDSSRQRSLNRFSTLIVSGNRCQLNSFVRVAGPPEEDQARPHRDARLAKALSGQPDDPRVRSRGSQPWRPSPRLGHVSRDY